MSAITTWGWGDGGLVSVYGWGGGEAPDAPPIPVGGRPEIISSAELRPLVGATDADLPKPELVRSRHLVPALVESDANFPRPEITATARLRPAMGQPQLHSGSGGPELVASVEIKPATVGGGAKARPDLVSADEVRPKMAESEAEKPRPEVIDSAQIRPVIVESEDD